MAEALSVDAGAGLDASLVRDRQVCHGPNELQAQRRRSPWRIFVQQLRDVMILVLLGAALVSGARAACASCRPGSSCPATW